MKNLFIFLAVISVFLMSCGGSSEKRTSTDQYMDQQIDAIADQKAAIKNEYKLRMERKKLQELWETYSDCDDVTVPKKKTELIEKKDTCCPSIVQNFFLTEKKAEPVVKKPEQKKISKQKSKPETPATPFVKEEVKEEVKKVSKPADKTCGCPATAMPTNFKNYSRWELLKANGCYGFKDPRGNGQDFRFASFNDMVSFWDANVSEAFFGYKRDF